MYTKIRNVQILISSLKAHDVRHVIHCTGGAGIPIGRSIEQDPFFTCYSLIDERSALYFAMGLSMANGNIPVAVVVTSGTAASNLESGMEEAYYKGVPIIAITADRSPYLLEQFEIQKTDQRAIFAGCSKMEVSLPIVNNDDEAWYCDRLVNESLLEMESGCPGPIHINVPTVGMTGLFEPKLPETKKIDRHYASEPEEFWARCAEELLGYSKIMVVVGENPRISAECENAMTRFFEKFNCMYSVEHMANYHGEGAVITYRRTEAMSSSAFVEFCPDLVIDFGGHVATVNLKKYLRERHATFRHWHIDESGRVRDGYRSLTDVFQCAPTLFFSKMVEHAPAEACNDKKYYKKWKEVVSEVDPPLGEVSIFRAASLLSERIPANSFLELGILFSTRAMQFFDLDPSVTVSANLGALGIDGCLSTAVGRAAATDAPVFIMQGDMSFFYDMNALNIRYIKSNLRVLLINNGGGAEFHIAGGRKLIPEIDEFVAASHHGVAEGWAKSRGFRYLSANTVQDLETGIEALVGESDRPMLLEVFTNRDADAGALDEFYKKYSGADTAEKMVGFAKNAVRRIIANK